MLLFALLCPILIWPLYKTVQKFGFNQTKYLVLSLFSFMIFGKIGLLILTNLKNEYLALASPFFGIFLCHCIYLVIGELSNEKEIKDRIDDEKIRN